MSNKLKLSYLTLLVVLTGALIVAPGITVAGMSSSSASLDDQTATVETTYTIEFTSDVSDDVEKVEVAFPSGFDISGAELESQANIGAGTLSVSGQVLTYTLDTKADLDSDAVDLVVSGIVNHSTAGDYSLSLQTLDEFGNTVDGASDITVTITPIPDHFAVTTENSEEEIAGTAFTVTVEAKDSSNIIINGYKGTHRIAFSSTGEGTIPSFIELDFTSGDITTSSNFILTNASQEPTITATDSALGFSGTSSAITVDPGKLDYFEMSGLPSSVTAGEAFTSDVTVTAYDAYDNVKTDYTMEVSFGSSDGSASLPSNHTFTSGTGKDNGSHAFAGSAFALKTVPDTGGQTITVSGAVGSGADVTKESSEITVNPAAASSMALSKSKDQITADGSDSTTITATVSDEYGNTATGYTDAVTFEASLGTLSEVDSNFSDGTATAKLSSTELGTANVVVTSGSFEKTTTVILGNTVYVDGDVGDNSNPGTEERPFVSVEYAVNNASVGQTIVVKPYTDGPYTPANSLRVDKDGLTLEAIGSSPVIIDVSSTTVGYQAAIEIAASNVTLDGFEVTTASGTVEGAGDAYMLKIIGGEYLPLSGITIQNNVFTAAEGLIHATALGITDGDVSDVTIADNEMVDVPIAIWIGGGNSNLTITGNSIHGENNYAADGAISFGAPSEVSSVTISDNTITDVCNNGIEFGVYGSPTYDNVTIEGNVIDGAAANAILIKAPNTTTITNLSITGNDLINSTDDGVQVSAWDSTNSINENNIYSNGAKGVDNDTTKTVDATENWWGDPSGPGDSVTTYVSYDPWLDAAYPDGEPTTVTATKHTRGIVQGWQMVSPHFRPAVEKASSVFGVGSRFNAVFYWDAQAGEYVVGDEANPIDSMKGLWLYSSDVVEPATVEGSDGYDMGDGYDVEADSTLTFVEGDGNESWNMIGVPFDVNWGQVTFDYGTDTGNTPTEAESEGWILNQVMAYNKSDNDYDVVGYNDAGSDVGLLEADTGYWMRVDADLSTDPTELVMNIPFNPGAAPSSAVAASIIENAPVSTATPPAPPAAPQGANAELKATAAMNNGSVTFEVTGADVQSINVQVFDLNGEEIFSDSESGSSLSWNANVANGIYLYGVSAKVNGQIKPLGIQKLLVLQ